MIIRNCLGIIHTKLLKSTTTEPPSSQMEICDDVVGSCVNISIESGFRRRFTLTILMIAITKLPVSNMTNKNAVYSPLLIFELFEISLVVLFRALPFAIIVLVARREAQISDLLIFDDTKVMTVRRELKRLCFPKFDIDRFRSTERRIRRALFPDLFIIL